MRETEESTGRPIVDPGEAAADIPVDTPPDSEEAKPPAAGESGKQAPMSKTRETVATVAAVVALILIAVFYTFMIRNVDATELHWARRMEILTGVEAIVFAAAGFLFGSQVQRRAQGARADAAEEKAEEAKRQARREELKAAREQAAKEAAAERQRQAELRSGKLAGVALGTTESVSGGERPRAGARRRGEETSAGGDGARFETLRRLAQEIIDQQEAHGGGSP